ncbi:MAG: FtsH protease activity modulator HflK [Holosporales bacterium]|jgi:membrane protease subunit HflK|nr:FtsH protease activity modulator HflK [Holosporales bacterium]
MADIKRNRFNPWDTPQGPEEEKDLPLGEVWKNFLRYIENFLGKRGSSPFRDGPGFPVPKRMALFLFILGGGLWIASGIYQVEPDERGVVLRFGEWVRTTHPGLRYHLPAPIETVLIQRMTTVHRIDIGAKPPSSPEDTPEEDLVLTGDSNIANISFSVLWRVKNDGVEHFLFNSRVPERIIRSAAESVMREIVGQNPITYTQTEGRSAINDKAQELLQSLLDKYNIGVEVVQILLQNVEPPAAVIDAFRDVERAQADQQSKVNQAEAYARELLARTGGKVASILELAKAKKMATLLKAQGDTAAFLLILPLYEKAPGIVAERLYIDALRDIYAGARKVVVDPAAQASGVIPYFPLSDLEKVRAPSVRETPPS